MRAPMISYHGLGNARSCRLDSALKGLSRDKRRMRRAAKRADRQAIRQGNYEAVNRGQSSYDIH